jgi:hypothetical protein
MVDLYLIAIGFDRASVIEGGYSESVEELEPGKPLKLLSQKESTQ